MSDNTNFNKSRCGDCLSSLQGMLKRERTSYSAVTSSSCCSSSSSTDNEEYIAVRRSLVDVYDEVFAICKLQNRETVAIAVSYLDRFMATQQQMFMNVQVAAMTCFYLAVKLYEPTVIPPAILCELFHRIMECGDDHQQVLVEDVDDDASAATIASAETIESMELTILQTLKWNVNPPTSIMFVRQLLCCLPNVAHLSAWKETTAVTVAEKQLEAGLKSESTMSFSASTQAVAALFCAVEELPAGQRAPVYKFLLQAVRMTAAKEQRQVLAVQVVLRALVVTDESSADDDELLVTEPQLSVKRSMTTTTTVPMGEIDCRPSKKQRVAVVEDSYAVSPRSILAVSH